MEINVSKNLFGNRIDKEFRLLYNSIYSAKCKKDDPIYCGFGKIKTQGPQSLAVSRIGGFCVKICGLMKLTLLDFPGKVACTVFLGGCNFRCPFCHNAELAFEGCGDEISEEDFFKFLEKRKGILDGVCVSGGEPLLYDEIIPFLKKIKDKGFAVKLDTNGCFPERLEAVIVAKACDYVAMDVKNSLQEYGKTVGIENFDSGGVEKSIEILKTSGIDHEFRTTVVKGLHTEKSIEDISLLLKNEKKYFLQAFVKSDRVPDNTLEEYTKDELENLLRIAQRNVPDAVLRGI